MALQKARQLALIKAHYGSLMASGPTFSLVNQKSFRTALLSPSSGIEQKRGNANRYSIEETRIASIRCRSTPTHPICFKCGDRGHKAFQCRNVLICFRCNKTGHNAASCPSFTSSFVSVNSKSSAGITDSASDPAMAPPTNRRGVARVRYQPFGARPANRDQQPPLHPVMHSNPPIVPNHLHPQGGSLTVHP